MLRLTPDRSLSFCWSFLVVLLVFLSFFANPVNASSATDVKSENPGSGAAALSARIEAYLTRTWGWRGVNRVVVESISPPWHVGLRRVKVRLSAGSRTIEKDLVVTVDGKAIIEGPVAPLNPHPWAHVRKRLELRGFPSEGNPNAPVVLVEFGDLECPPCKAANPRIQKVFKGARGQLQVIFKYFPLSRIHPWALQAATAAACVAKYRDSAFWKFEQMVFDNQLAIKPGSARKQFLTYAIAAGVPRDGFDACLHDPAIGKLIQSSIENGKALGVHATPTLFLDGREIQGCPPIRALTRMVNYEVGLHAAATTGFPPAGAVAGSNQPDGN